MNPLLDLSRDSREMVCINVLERLLYIFVLKIEIPHEGPMADLVWSDPDPGREEFAVSPR